MNVQFSASFGIQQMEKKLDVLTPEEWIAWRSEINNQNYVKAYGSKGAMATDDYEIRLAYTGGSVNTSYVNDPRWIQPGYGDLMAIDWQDEVSVWLLNKTIPCRYLILRTSPTIA